MAHTVFDAVVNEYVPIKNTLPATVDAIEDKLLDEDLGSGTDVFDGLYHFNTS